MIFSETDLNEVFVIETERLEDERGFFCRMWDQNLFERKGLNAKMVQCSISFNKKKGTLRGMHYQAKPYEESKLVRCTKGKIYDIIIDIRRDSKNFGKWISVELSEKNQKAVFIPKGFAHGFQTLEDISEVFYQISEFYKEEYARGFRWDDPFFSIKWPIKNPIISKKDLSYQFLKKSIDGS